jgi:hypothetical protein
VPCGPGDPAVTKADTDGRPSPAPRREPLRARDAGARDSDALAGYAPGVVCLVWFAVLGPAAFAVAARRIARLRVERSRQSNALTGRWWHPGTILGLPDEPHNHAISAVSSNSPRWCGARPETEGTSVIPGDEARVEVPLELEPSAVELGWARERGRYPRAVGPRIRVPNGRP